MSIEELEMIAVKVYGEESEEVEMIKMHINSLNLLIDNGSIHNDFGLNDVEILSLIMLEGFCYNIIQKPAFNKELLDEFSEILVYELDAALLKIPKTSSMKLYRQDKYHCGIPKVGDVLVFKGFFSTSKDDYNNTYNIKWIIMPLSNELTKAHDIYKVYNHGYNNYFPEWQVEFERNTKFLVTQVENKNHYTEVYIKELQD